MPNPTQDFPTVLAVVLIGYTVAMYALALAVRGRIHDTADYLVAGRRLPLSLAWATIFATWFGAGTLLTAADEVRHGGVERAALDPVGAGLCLILAGLFFARPLWEMGLLTVSDFFRRKFGPRAELLSAIVLVPSYFGWIAAQLVALSELLGLFFGIERSVAIPLVAIVAMGYTLLGGMWSVTLTDAVQLAFVLLGLVLLGGLVLGELGGGSLVGGFNRLLEETPPEMLRVAPAGSARALLDWLAVVAVGALGNLPGQDLLQRVFAAKSAVVARRACLLAGVFYLGFGVVPVLLGLAARILLPEDTSDSILPALAQLFLQPLPALIFLLALVSAVLSTIDSAVLSPAGVLAQNVFPRFDGGRISPLGRNYVAVVLVMAASVAMAFFGEDAYGLLEDAYELPLAGLFVPLTMGLYRPVRGEAQAVASIVVGTTLWVVHYAAGWETFFGVLEVPSSLMIPAVGFVAYVVAGRRGGAGRP